MTTSHYLEAEKLLTLAGTHTDTGDERDAQLAALFTARAQAHATLALAAQPDEQTKPAPEPESVPLYRAAETWGDDIEVKPLDRPGARWRVRGGKLLFIGLSGVKWLDVTETSSAMVTLVSREPYRDDPWAPGQDVTDRLEAGETAPEGTVLTDCEGGLYRAEADGRFTDWWKSWGGWWPAPDWAWNRRAMGRLRDCTPIRVATPEQITAAGIHTGGQR